MLGRVWRDWFTNKKVVTFLKKSNQKTFDFPRRLSGHAVAAQTPGMLKVFCGAFFQKSDRFLRAEL
jgi:hypothetical protein